MILKASGMVMLGVHISEKFKGRRSYCVLHWETHTSCADVGVDVNSNIDSEFSKFLLHPPEEQDPDKSDQ